MQNGCTGWAGTQGKQKRISTRNLNIALCFEPTGRWGRRMQNGCIGWRVESQLVAWRQTFPRMVTSLQPFLCVTRRLLCSSVRTRRCEVLRRRATCRCRWFCRRQVLKARLPGAFTLPLTWQEIYGLDNLKNIFPLLWTHFYICKWSMMGNWVFKFWVLKKCLLFVQGVFVPWPSPNKLKYEKPRLGESTLALIALYTFNLAKV